MDRTLTVKLLLALVSVAAITVVIGVTGLRGVGGLAHDVRRIHDRAAVPMTDLTTAQAAYHTMEIKTLQHLATTDSAATKQIEADIKASTPSSPTPWRRSGPISRLPR
jgi:hypothetical protein